MAKGIYQSCDVYYYHFAQALGMNPISEMARRYGMGQEFPLPVISQFYGTVPDPAWKLKKYDQPWQPFDTVNATIGQGYMLSNPLQLAVMAARLATSEIVVPRIQFSSTVPKFESMGVSADDKFYIRQAMSDVVNGPGTAGRAKLPIENVLMAGKTGTAQVVGLNLSDGKTGPWKYRDHGLFIFFAPFDNPRYAGAVVIEHGGGSGAAYPIARDVMTYLFDPQKGIDALLPLEKQWGGTAQQRLSQQYRTFASAAGESVAPLPARTEDIFDKVEAEARLSAEAQLALGGQPVTPREDAAPSSVAQPLRQRLPHLRPSPPAQRQFLRRREYLNNERHRSGADRPTTLAGDPPAAPARRIRGGGSPFCCRRQHGTLCGLPPCAVRRVYGDGGCYCLPAAVVHQVRRVSRLCGHSPAADGRGGGRGNRWWQPAVDRSRLHGAAAV
jgi:penicillin-binding protein 2